MEVEGAEKQLNGLIEKRARGQQAANAEVALWKEPACRRREQIRREENTHAWAEHYASMARVIRDEV